MSAGVVLQAIVAGLSAGAVYGLVGLGFTLVWSMTRVLAFAHGDVVVGAVLLAVLAVVGTTPVASSLDVAHSIALVVLTLAIGTGLSTASYLVVVRPFLARRHRPTDLLGWVAGGVTGGLVIRTAVGVALPAAAYAVPDPLHLDQLRGSGVVHLPGGGVVGVRVFPVLVIAAGAAIAVDRLLAISRVGRGMRAVADDPDVASMCGVPVERVVLTAFAVAGLLAAVAALLIAPAGPVSVDRGAVLGLYGAAAALLGRLGVARDAVVGGVVIGVAQQLVAVTPHLGASWSQLLPLALLVVVVAIRPAGLFSPRVTYAE